MNEELKLKIQGIIEEGYANEESEDNIKMAMFTAGVPFSDLNSSFKELSIDSGLMVDPKVVSKGIQGAVEQADWTSINEWGDLVEAAGRIVAEVDGATQANVISKARAYCKNEEIALPTKPKSSGGARATSGSKVHNAVLALLKENPNATRTEAFNVLYPVIGGKARYSNTLYTINSSFLLAKAAVLGISIMELSTEMAAQPVPADPELREGGLELFAA